MFTCHGLGAASNHPQFGRQAISSAGRFGGVSGQGLHQSQVGFEGINALAASFHAFFIKSPQKEDTTATGFERLGKKLVIVFGAVTIDFNFIFTRVVIGRAGFNHGAGFAGGFEQGRQCPTKFVAVGKDDPASRRLRL